MSMIAPLAASNPQAAPYAVGIVLGFLIGGFGHLIKAPAVIAVGILLIGVTSALFVVVADPSF